MSYVTDRPTPGATPECSQAQLDVELEKTPSLIHVPPESKTAPADNADLYHKKSPVKKINILSDIKITPEFVRPFPKAEPRLKKGKFVDRVAPGF